MQSRQESLGRVRLDSTEDTNSKKHIFYDQVACKQLDGRVRQNQLNKIMFHSIKKQNKKQKIQHQLNKVMVEPSLLQLCNIFNINREVLKRDQEDRLGSPYLIQSSGFKINSKRNKKLQEKKIQLRLKKIESKQKPLQNLYDVKQDSPYNTNQFLVRKYRDDIEQYSQEPQVVLEEKYFPGSMLNFLLSEDQANQVDTDDSLTQTNPTVEQLQMEISQQNKRIQELQQILAKNNISY